MRSSLWVWQGSCGYGMLDKEKWPFWSVGALATSNMFYEQGPVHGCGYAIPALHQSPHPTASAIDQACLLQPAYP